MIKKIIGFFRCLFFIHNLEFVGYKHFKEEGYFEVDHIYQCKDCGDRFRKYNDRFSKRIIDLLALHWETFKSDSHLPGSLKYLVEHCIKKKQITGKYFMKNKKVLKT